MLILLVVMVLGIVVMDSLRALIKIFSLVLSVSVIGMLIIIFM